MEENGQVHRVVGGTPAEGSLTWSVAALYVDGAYECTGVLVGPNHILTAGHCSAGIDEAVWVDGVRTPVFRRSSHPGWLGGLDAQVLTVGGPNGVGLPAVPIALRCGREALQDGVVGTVMGYGAQVTSGQQEEVPILMAADVPLIDVACDDPGRGCRTDVEEGSELIAGGDGVDACPGDSGGPLFVDGMLAGTVSRGTLLGRTTCGDGGIYVQAHALASWLMREGVQLQAPACAGEPFLPAVPAKELYADVWQGISLPEVPGATVEPVALSQGLKVRQRDHGWQVRASEALVDEGARVALHVASPAGDDVVEGVWSVMPDDGACQTGPGAGLALGLFAALCLRRR